MLTAIAMGMTALICGSDGIAIEALAALRDNGIEVPGHVTVTGYDDIPDSVHWSPPLTTVAQPTKALCDAVLDLLERMIKRNAGDEVLPLKEIVPPKLVIRASSGVVKTGPTKENDIR